MGATKPNSHHFFFSNWRLLLLLLLPLFLGITQMTHKVRVNDRATVFTTAARSHGVKNRVFRNFGKRRKKCAFCCTFHCTDGRGVAGVGSVGFFFSMTPAAERRAGSTEKKGFCGGAKRRNFCHHTLIYESLFGGSFLKKEPKGFFGFNAATFRDFSILHRFPPFSR